MIVFIAVQLISSYIFSFKIFDTTPRNSVISDWQMKTSENRSDIEGAVKKWDEFGKIDKDQFSLTPKFVRLNKTFANLKKDDVLVIKSEYNPLKVTINGETVAYHDYGREDSYIMFTEQRLALVNINKDYDECEIDIYLTAQTSVELHTWMEKNIKQVSFAFLPLITLLMAAVFLTLGIFFILFSLGAHSVDSVARGLTFSGFVMLSIGSLIAIQVISSYFNLNYVNMFRMQYSFTMLIAIFAGCTMFSMQGKWRKFQKIFACIAFAYVLAFFFIPIHRITNILFLIYPLLCLLCAAMGIEAFIRAIPGFTSKKNICALLLLVSCVFFSYAMFSHFISIRSMPVILFSVALSVLFGYDLLHGTIYREIRLKEQHSQTAKSSALLDRIIALSAQVFSSKDIIEFSQNMARSLKTIILEDINEGGKQGTFFDDSLGSSVAIKEDGSFKVVYTDDEQENCNFNMIEKRINQSGAEYILFGVTYVDLFLRHGDDIYIICHINGLRRGISDNLKNVLKTTYANISNAFDNLNLKSEIVETQYNLFFNLANITEAKSQSTGNHIRRVSQYTKLICLEYGMSKEESELISQASMMHDLGKLAVSEQIIQKKGSLTKQERAVMKNHVVFGYNILSSSPGIFMEAAAVIAQQHHEYWDGSGYIGLEGEEIHPYARIVAIADVFDALTSSRSYKAAWSLEESRIFINEKIDVQFERKAVEAFNRCFDKIIKIHNELKDKI